MDVDIGAVDIGAGAAVVGIGAVGPLFMGRAAAVRAATKAKTDDRKAKVNALFGKRIIMAIKQGTGGPDPIANRQLADVIKQAKANSVPVENINRAIKKASEGNAGDFTESTFEAYGHGGASFVINVLSDNPNRASSDVKSTVHKRHGKIAEPGSVLFLYDKRGCIQVTAEEGRGIVVLEEEALLDAAIAAGCNDMELIVDDDDNDNDDSVSPPSSRRYIVYTDPKEAALMVDAIQSLLGGGGGADNNNNNKPNNNDNVDIKMSLTWVSKAPVECSDEDFEKNMQIIEALEDLDDVDSVQHNMIIN